MRGNQLRKRPLVVGDRDYRGLAIQAGSDMRAARRLIGVLQIPALHRPRFALQFGVAGCAPDLRIHPPVVAQLLGCRLDFGEHGARPQQPDGRRVLTRQAVKPPDDVGLHAFGQAGVVDVFVGQRQVIEHVLLTVQHGLHAMVDDDRDLVGQGRVIGPAIRDRGSHQMAVAVLVLQTLAAQRGPAGRCPQQKPAGPLVGGRPDQIAHALEAEHRVVDVKRQHGHAMHRVTGRSGHPAAQRACLADAFFQNLAVQRLAVAQDGTDVFRLVLLPRTGIDAELLEQVGHAEGPRLIRDDGHDTWAE